MAESKLFNDPEPIFKNSNWGLTKFDVLMFKYRWDILHFMALPKVTTEYCEKNIPTEAHSSTKWYLRVYPNGKDASYKDYVSVFLHYTHLFGETVKTRYSVELRDGSHNVIVARNCEYAQFSPLKEHGFYQFIKRDTLQKALEKANNGTLTIFCTIKEYTDVESESSSLTAPNLEPNNAHAANLLKTLLTKQAYTDFTINVKGQQFKVHKAVLCTCSPVFAAMLSIEMSEREKNETKVDDVEPDVFEKIVEFMYTGSVATINDNAMELVPVAHKYDLKGLLEQCEAVLSCQISTDLAVKLLVLSNLYSLEYLKNVAMQYIKANLNVISQTSDWKTYVANDPKLLTLLLMG